MMLPEMCCFSLYGVYMLPALAQTLCECIFIMALISLTVSWCDCSCFELNATLS